MWFNYSAALWLLPPQEQLCLWDIRRDNYSRSCGLGDLIALRKKKIPENTEHPRACMHAHTHDALRALVTVIRVLPREACSRLMCLIVGQEKRRARTTWGHTVCGECDEDGDCDKANCRAFVQGDTDDAHGEGQREHGKKRGESRVSVNVAWMLSLKSWIAHHCRHVTTTSIQFECF